MGWNRTHKSAAEAMYPVRGICINMYLCMHVQYIVSTAARYPRVTSIGSYSVSGALGQ